MQLISRLLILPIRFYQRAISPLTPPSCRFVPSCSSYAIEAIRIHGPAKGLFLAARRIMRCHPWGGSGFDPVPPEGTSWVSRTPPPHPDKSQSDDT